VREYLVWLVAEARLEWFCLEDDDYRPQLPDAQGVLLIKGSVNEIDCLTQEEW